jgi:uncharacterized protein
LRVSLTVASPVLLDEVRDARPAEHETTEAHMLAYRQGNFAEVLRAIATRSLDPDALPEEATHLTTLATGRKRYTHCGIGKGMRAISVNGDFYPCHRFAGVEDVRMGGLENHRAESLNDYHRAIVDDLPACSSCWARYFCGGGCLYENRASTGDMHTPSPLFCEHMRILCEDAIAGWCGLSAEDQAYARGMLEKVDDRSDSRRP